MAIGMAALLAVALKVGIPAFDTENVPAFIGVRLSQQLAAALNEGACGEAIPSTGLSGPALEDLRACYGQPSCVAGAGAGLGLDKVVLGTVHREETRFLVQVLLVDVRRKRVERNVADALPNRLDMLPLAAKRAARPLCEALLKAGAGEELALADVQLDIPGDPDAFGTLPLPELDLEIPDPTPPATTANAPAPPTPPAPVKTAPPPLPAASALVAVAPAPAPKPVVPPSAPARSAVPVAAVKAPVAPVRVSRPPPAWAWWLVGAGGAAVVLGSGLGLGSTVIRGHDTALADRSGLTRHTLTRSEALRANGLATGANVSFLLGFGVAAAGGTLLLVPDLLP